MEKAAAAGPPRLRQWSGQDSALHLIITTAKTPEQFNATIFKGVKMLKIGIIGAGRRGLHYASLLERIEKVKVKGVYDPVPEAAGKVFELYSVNIFHSADDLIRSQEIDAVLISSPTYCHAAEIESALKSGKPVFCEKPLCANQDDAGMLAKLRSKHQQTFAMGFQRRKMNTARKVKEILDTGHLGRIRFFNVDLPHNSYKRKRPDWFADFNLCGGVLLDMLAHHADLANWFFGKAKQVYADGLLLAAELPEPADYAAAIVTYDNGVIGHFMCNWQRFGRSGEMMEIYGDNGTLSLSGKQLTLELKGQKVQALDLPENDPQMEIILNFVESIRSGKEPSATFQDAFNSLQVCLAMIQSVKCGQAVRL